MSKAKTEATPQTKEQPEITLDGLLQNAEQSEENLKAVFFKQQGVKEFLAALKRDGYTIVKAETD